MFISGNPSGSTSGKRRMLTAAAAGIAALGLVIGGASAALADDKGGAGHGGPFGSLVQAGTITAAQAQAVKAALRSKHTESREDHQQERQALVAQVLADLVSAGKITSAQAAAITAADRKELRDLVTSGTLTREVLASVREAMHEAIEAKKDEFKADKAADLSATLAELVSKGTLTQAQSTAIQQAISEHHADGHGRRGRR